MPASNAPLKRPWALKSRCQGTVTGALGAARWLSGCQRTDCLVGLAVSEMDHAGRSFYCTDCANNCEIVEVTCDNAVVARWGVAAANGRQRRSRGRLTPGVTAPGFSLWQELAASILNITP